MNQQGMVNRASSSQHERNVVAVVSRRALFLSEQEQEEQNCPKGRICDYHVIGPANDLGGYVQEIRRMDPYVVLVVVIGSLEDQSIIESLDESPIPVIWRAL